MTTPAINPNPIIIHPKAAQEFALVESIAAACSLDVLGSQGHFTRALTMARGIKALREAITPQMMNEILSLQGSSLGFRTDKDKDGGYDPETVKECAIECALRGGHWVGNEFNIIAGRAYMTKEFFTRKVREFPGLTDLKHFPGVPRFQGETGALVPYSITWRLHGDQYRIDRLETKLEDGTLLDERICVRVNKGMGADAVLGKAERKILAAVYKQLTGSDVADGESEPGSVSRPMRPGLSGLTERLTEKTNGNGTHPEERDENYNAGGEYIGPTAEEGFQKSPEETEQEKFERGVIEDEQLDRIGEEFNAAVSATTDQLSKINAILTREEGKPWSEAALAKLATMGEAAKEAVRKKRGGNAGKQKELAGAAT